MALNIKNKEVEQLAAEVSKLTGESKVEAIKLALAERKLRLEADMMRPKRERVYSFLIDRVWCRIPEDILGGSVSTNDNADILGFGPEGV